jgi:hypothetical protein
MRIHFKVRTLLVVIVFLAALMVLGHRAWNSEWAPFYAKRHEALKADLVFFRGMEATYRSRGQERFADQLKARAVETEERLRENWWLWLKALFIDES